MIFFFQSVVLSVCLTEFLCVALDVLELSVDQAVLYLTEIHLPLPPECYH